MFYVVRYGCCKISPVTMRSLGFHLSNRSIILIILDSLQLNIFYVNHKSAVGALTLVGKKAAAVAQFVVPSLRQYFLGSL